MAETPERPARACFQNVSTPMPIGETRPSPVTTTRFFTGALARRDASFTFYAKDMPASNRRAAGGSGSRARELGLGPGEPQRHAHGAKLGDRGVEREGRQLPAPRSPLEQSLGEAALRRERAHAERVRTRERFSVGRARRRRVAPGLHVA